MCGIWCRIVKGREGGGPLSGEEGCELCRITKEDSNHYESGQDEEARRTSDANISMFRLHERRGPDLHSQQTIIIDEPSTSTRSDSVHVHLSGHVLWTQGPEPLRQPHCSPDGRFYFLFNGDIYSFSSGEEEEFFHPEKENDGLLLFQKLIKHVGKIPQVLEGLRGPFAFILVDRKTSTLWFARDFFGRQSLLLGRSGDADEVWDISSVSSLNSTDIIEVPAVGLFKWTLSDNRIEIIPYEEQGHERIDVMKSLDSFKMFLNGLDVRCSENLKVSLNFKTRLKLEFEPKECLMDMYDRLKILFDKNENKPLKMDEVLISATDILDDWVERFLMFLRKSVRLRLKAIAPICKDCMKKGTQTLDKNCDHPRVGVLFSGGLDSTVLAYLAAEALDQVDFLNVAFAKENDENHYDSVPDRETGIESYDVLNSIFEPQGKSIRLIKVNVTKEQVVEMRKKAIRNLISPLCSVIDDSVGCCLWFASGGADKSPVRTVLMGSGADELLGGYSRHRSAYENSGYSGLVSEMQMDLDRISIRNMGRDNRVVSDHGLSPRMPYLDESLVNFLTQDCPPWIKCCPLLPRGFGEKLLLRCAAVKLFGPQNVRIASFPKRAMQFGSRIAKLENTKEKGGDKCDRLL